MEDRRDAAALALMQPQIKEKLGRLEVAEPLCSSTALRIPRYGAPGRLSCLSDRLLNWAQIMI